MMLLYSRHLRSTFGGVITRYATKYFLRLFDLMLDIFTTSRTYEFTNLACADDQSAYSKASPLPASSDRAGGGVSSSCCWEESREDRDGTVEVLDPGEIKRGF